MMGQELGATRETRSRDALSATNPASVVLHPTATSSRVLIGRASIRG